MIVFLNHLKPDCCLFYGLLQWLFILSGHRNTCIQLKSEQYDDCIEIYPEHKNNQSSDRTVKGIVFSEIIDIIVKPNGRRYKKQRSNGGAC